MNVHVKAVITSKDECKDEVKNHLFGFLSKARSEDGCIEYTLSQDVENDNIFVFNEIWESQEKLDTHSQKGYLQGLFAPEFARLINGEIKITLLKTLA